MQIAKDYKPYVSTSPVIDSNGVAHDTRIRQAHELQKIKEREKKEKKRITTLKANKAIKKKAIKQPKNKVIKGKQKIPTYLKDKYKLSLTVNHVSAYSRVVITRFARLYGRGNYEQGMIYWIEYVTRIREEMFRVREGKNLIGLDIVNPYYTLKRAKEGPIQKVFPETIRGWRRLTTLMIDKQIHKY